ncbi:MAG TPA: lantibiotic dehydratase [Thermoleophilaceae bacterium]|nr:lantibiotic dehydratase [Thermoleophilaceae bacterium]
MSSRPRADFFALRAPLLALETLSRWAEGIRALDAADAELEEALAADRALLRVRLMELLADEQIGDALAVASPDLADGVARWRIEPDTKRGRSAERSLVRYLTRLASRPDLFGLAGAYLTGGFGDNARLELRPRSELEVRARVDSGLLREVVRRAASEAIESSELVVRRNPGIYRVGGRLRVAARKQGSSGHRLVEMRSTPAIELALETAADGASIASLATALVAAGSPADHAPDLVRRLIRSDLLMPVAQVTVTGPEPTEQALEALASLPDGDRYAQPTQRAVALVATAPRVSREVIEAAADALAPTGVEFSRRHCLQIDARRPGEARLPERVLAEMRRNIDLLARITAPEGAALRSFKEAFERRFATRRVPLLEALDPDFGIRLGTQTDDGTATEPATDGSTTGRRRSLLALVDRGRADGTVELSDADVATLSGQRPAALPDAFAMLTSLVGRDGDFRLVEPAVTGPSGARLLGRLCRGDEELERQVREHLCCEAALEPGAIFAELSIAPETEVGFNITQRPVLREWEIDYGGGSGAPPDRRIEPSDLVVSLENDQVVLRSQSLGRRVVPCCTTAMNAMWVSLPAARFLLSIEAQRSPGYFSWSWDLLGDAPALPRVTRGRAILALRRWNVSMQELAQVRPGTDAAGFRRLQEWRDARGLPRLVSFDHPKNRVLVDFGNVLSVDAFLAAAKDVDIVRFIEAPAAEESPVTGPDGHYVHELVVPFTLDRLSTPAPPRRTPKTVNESSRRFPPGSEWLYANLYGPVGGADRVLVEHVGPLVRQLRENGVVDRWFFIRYADPSRHLRVRFHGRPDELIAEALPALNEALAPALAEGLLYRISLDTYEREAERYGGIEGVELMERVAEADSDAVLALLEQRMDAVTRRHLTVASLAALYADAGLPLATRRSCCVQLRTAWAPPGRSLGRLLGTQERSERARLMETVEAPPGPLSERSAVLAGVFASLRALDEEGELELPLPDIGCSLAHMSVNRLLKRGANMDEVQVHDALARLYEAEMARDRSRLASEPPLVG